MRILCYLRWHDWDGCKCKRCGDTRNEQHDWDGCKCKRCGKIEHDWKLIKRDVSDSESDEWYGGHSVTLTTTRTDEYYRCRKCGKERHDWSSDSGMGGTRGSSEL